MGIISDLLGKDFDYGYWVDIMYFGTECRNHFDCPEIHGAWLGISIGISASVIAVIVHRENKKEKKNAQNN